MSATFRTTLSSAATAVSLVQSRSTKAYACVSSSIVRVTFTVPNFLGLSERDWTNETAVAAEERVVLNVADIYNDPAVNIRPSAYESLSLVELLPTTGIRLENGANNALTLIIPKNTAAGDYTATAKFGSNSSSRCLRIFCRSKACTSLI